MSRGCLTYRRPCAYSPKNLAIFGDPDGEGDRFSGGGAVVVKATLKYRGYNGETIHLVGTGVLDGPREVTKSKK